MLQSWRVFERVLSCVFFGKKIKGVEYSDLRHQVDLHPEPLRRLWKNQPCLPVGKWILLPIEKLPRRINTERIRLDHSPRVRSRAQAHDVRR